MSSGDDHGPGQGAARGVPTGRGTGDQSGYHREGSALGAYCDSCGATAYGSDEQISAFAKQHVCGGTE